MSEFSEAAALVKAKRSMINFISLAVESVVSSADAAEELHRDARSDHRSVSRPG